MILGKLLELMMDDMKSVSNLYRPTHHLEQVSHDLLHTIDKHGVERFREIPEFLYAFVPTYAYPGFYLKSGIYEGIYEELSEIFPSSSNIEDSQTYTNLSKFQKRLKDLFSGSLHAVSDYRVFIASASSGPPYINKVSESTVGNPIEQSIFAISTIEKKSYGQL